MNESQIVSKAGTLQFYGVNEIYLPKACVACGKETEDSIRKSIFGRLSFSKKERRDYHVDLPVCERCVKNSKIDKSIEIVKILIPTIISLILLVVIALFTYSILMGLGLVGISFMITFLHYKTRMAKRVNLNKFVQLRSMPLEENGPEDVLEFKFLNKEYAEKTCDINLDRNKSLQLVESLNFIRRDQVPSFNSSTCPRCGNLQQSNQKFCTECGTPFIENNTRIVSPLKKIQGSISKINDSNKSTSNFNKIEDLQKYSISTDQTKRSCPYCKSLIPTDSIFCTICGKRL